MRIACQYLPATLGNLVATGVHLCPLELKIPPRFPPTATRTLSLSQDLHGNHVVLGIMLCWGCVWTDRVLRSSALSYLMHNSSFVMQNSSFVIQNSWFLMQNSPALRSWLRCRRVLFGRVDTEPQQDAFVGPQLKADV